jgi:AcrR family transcriptional regulator
MARSIPAGRLQQLVDRAAETFIAQGYQRTQMEDLATALGVAKGTLYGYVESKAALLEAALRFSDGREPVPNEDQLPLPTPRAGETIARVQARLLSETQGTELSVALGRQRVHEPASELAAIIRDLYERMSRNRRAMKLLDRCSNELPEFASVWFGEGRWAQHAALAQYLELRIAKGHLRAVSNIPVVARLILETIAFWAVHRHWDPSPQEVSETQALATVTDMILHGLSRE